MEEIMNVENTALANPFNNESNFKMLMKMAEAFASTEIILYLRKPPPSSSAF